MQTRKMQKAQGILTQDTEKDPKDDCVEEFLLAWYQSVSN